jgi:imidazolonepropionase-like amidohydrolase
MLSRLTRSTALSALLTVSGGGIATTATAQLGERAIPGTYAITNARIVPVSGPTIDRGTIVIRDGLIVSVGAAATAPADARIIDGAGLTVYPGFIDAMSNVGVPAPRGGGGGGGGGFGFGQQQSGPSQPPVAAPNSEHPVGLQPELRIIDVLRFETDALDAPRAAGLTTVLATPREGIFMGQSALINLAGTSAQDMLLRSPVALHIGFTPVRGGYPGSLLGVFASLRQMLLDAQRYRDMQAAYTRNPRGMRRPDTDASLAALVPVLAKEVPVIMHANAQREIERALDLANEFGLRAFIAGGEEAWKVADRLKRENVPVIATLNFPRRAGGSTEDADPEPIRLLQSRVDAPKNAGRLATAGVRVAFTSGGVTMTEFLANLRRAVETGLSRDQALRALTLTPAELFGVADRVGTIEPGKIANLTVVRGDLFDRAGRVTQVFIDGRPITVRAPAAETADANVGSGTWTITATFAEGERTLTLNLRQDGENLRGSIQGSLGSGDISNGSLTSGGDLRFTVPIVIGQTSEEATFSGTLTGNVMRGSIAIIGRPNGTFVGTRPDQGPRGGGQRPPAGARPPASR